jgi:hypothetical protein
VGLDRGKLLVATREHNTAWTAVEQQLGRRHRALDADVGETDGLERLAQASDSNRLSITLDEGGDGAVTSEQADFDRLGWERLVRTKEERLEERVGRLCLVDSGCQ